MPRWATSTPNPQLKLNIKLDAIALKSEVIDTLLQRLIAVTTVVDPHSTLDLVATDPADNRVLECAIARGASYIVTGDTHLLELKEYQQIVISQPAAFLVLRLAQGIDGWPETLLSWDILFLIPLRWWGPVLSPVLFAALICASAVLMVARLGRGERLELDPARIGSLVAGGLLALYVFMSDSLYALLQGRSDWDTLRPEPFKWPLFLVALALMALPGLAAVWPGHPGPRSSDPSR